MLQQSLTWVTSILENFIFAGAFFGWANLYPVLQDENYFTESCPRNNGTLKGRNGTSSCSSQEEALSLVYTIASSATIFHSVFVGMVFDRFGMWVSRTVLINAAALSYLLIAISNFNSSYLLYLAFPIINLAGSGLMLNNVQLANLFPKFRVLYCMSVAGAFNSASVTYLFMNRMYYAGFDFTYVLYAYAGIYFVLNLRTLLLTPKFPIPFVLPPNYQYGYKELWPSSDTSAPTTAAEEKMKIVTTGTGDHKSAAINPDEKSMRAILTEVYFYTGMLALVIVRFVTTFYISTLNMFFESILGSHNETHINHYTTIFGIMQCCSVVVTPINGMLVEYIQRRYLKSSNDYFASMKAYAIGFLMASICLISMVICTLVPVASIQIIAMVMQILCRIFFPGAWNAFLTLVFPSQHFGKLFGITFFVNGLFLFLQYPCTLILTRVLDHNFTVMSGCLLVVSCFTLVHPLYLLHYCRCQEKPKNEAAEFHDNAVSIKDET